MRAHPAALRGSWLLLLALLLARALAVKQDEQTKAAADPEVDFDYLTLTRTWPPTLCKLDACSQPTYNLFTIGAGGLAPSNYKDPQPADCPSDIVFKKEALPVDLRGRMSCEWRNFRTGDLPSLWAYEWSKHGTCAAPLFAAAANDSDPLVAYFEAAMRLHEKYDINEAMVRSGFNPLAATKATAAQLVGLLQEQWGVNTLITCVEGQVYEIQTCFNLKLKPIDCPGESKCGRTAQDLPYGGPIPQVCQAYIDNVPAAANVGAPSPPPPPSPPSSSSASAAPAAALLLLAAVVAQMAAFF